MTCIRIQPVEQRKAVVAVQVYTHFAEALDGLVTIRAFDSQPRFAATNEALVTATQRASIAGVATAQWLALRLQLMTAMIVFLIALLAVLDAEDVLPSAAPGRPINVGAFAFVVSGAHVCHVIVCAAPDSRRFL